MAKKTVLAVDLGAESGRVMAVHFDGRALDLEELARFPNTTVSVGGTLHWDFLRLWGDIQAGLAAGLPLRPAGIGVDTWGVDFALLDRQGKLIGNPVHYRDGRTNGMMERAFARAPRAEIFAATGIQFMPINTLYQFLSLVESGSPQLDIAHTLLFAPDLLNYWLAGAKVSEFSIASTSQMLAAGQMAWATELLGDLGLPTALLPEVVPPGTRLGAWEGVPVIAPATHDTGSAVAAVPAGSADFAYLSSGTWSLIGLEVPQPILGEAALAANVTNEGGVYGTYRLLKNVMGLWLLQQCRAAWQGDGREVSYDELVRLAAAAPPFSAVIDVNDPVFIPPGDMPGRIHAYCAATGQPAPQGMGEMARVILDSLALAYAEALAQITAVAGRSVSALHIVGGGSRNDLLNQLTADATGLPVITGPVEATVLGNALVQLISLGEIGGLDEGRRIIGAMGGQGRFEPRPDTAVWQEARARYRQVANRPAGS